MIIISGCPRSGTSLMMDIMRETFGEKRILGKKFPQDQKIKYYNNQAPKETNGQYDIRKYKQELNERKSGINPVKDFEETKDMNPNGFWEMLYTVQGCFYRFKDANNLEILLKEKEKSICKIVSQGLINSDPQYIDKIIYMIRHPRAVAKSQERLKRNLPSFQTEKGIKHLEDEVTIHSPEMYINVTIQAAKWLLKYKNKEVLFLHFEDLLEQPEKELKRVQSFLNEGDFTESIKRINPKLRRSYPQDVKNNYWEISEKIYKAFSEKDYRKVISFQTEYSKLKQDTEKSWFCERVNRMTYTTGCKSCYSDARVKKRLAKSATERGINWENLPCLYECENKGISIKDSIKNNNWMVEDE